MAGDDGVDPAEPAQQVDLAGAGGVTVRRGEGRQWFERLGEPGLPPAVGGDVLGDGAQQPGQGDGRRGDGWRHQEEPAGVPVVRAEQPRVDGTRR